MFGHKMDIAILVVVTILVLLGIDYLRTRMKISLGRRAHGYPLEVFQRKKNRILRSAVWANRIVVVLAVVMLIARVVIEFV